MSQKERIMDKAYGPRKGAPAKYPYIDHTYCKCDACVEQKRDDLLLRFFCCAMQGDWAAQRDAGYFSKSARFDNAAKKYLLAAREALKVWEARDGQA